MSGSTSQPETGNYDTSVYQLQATDNCQGATSSAQGVLNQPLLNLANRTGWLKNQIATILTNLAGYALINSPTFTGTPQAPTPPAGDNSTAVATTGFVSSVTPSNIVVFTYGSPNTWTVPAGKTQVKVRIWGGGGAGGDGNGGCGDGGSGAGYGEGYVSVTPGETLVVQVGYGGQSTVNNGTGGQSQFGSNILAYGGTGGSPGVAGSEPPNAIGGPHDKTCVFPGGWSQNGAEGGKGDDRAPTSSISGGGAPSFGGRGGVQLPRYNTAGFPGNMGTLPGSGGSGGSGSQRGGNGAAGLVIIEY